MTNDAGKVADLVAKFHEGGECSRDGCSDPATAIPKFTFRPFEGYTGAPFEMLVRLRLCDGHRAWFTEVGARELLEDGTDTEGKPRQGLLRVVAAAGVKVDSKLTTWELLPLAQP